MRLRPGDTTRADCGLSSIESVPASAPNTTDFSRLGLLFVYRGSHTQTDPALKAAYAAASAVRPYFSRRASTLPCSMN